MDPLGKGRVPGYIVPKLHLATADHTLHSEPNQNPTEVLGKIHVHFTGFRIHEFLLPM